MADGFGLVYDGIDIRKLSPGTQSIVLPLLYLALNDADDRPLIISSIRLMSAPITKGFVSTCNADYTVIGRFSELSMDTKVMEPKRQAAFIGRPDDYTVYAGLPTRKRAILIPTPEKWLD